MLAVLSAALLMGQTQAAPAVQAPAQAEVKPAWMTSFAEAGKKAEAQKQPIALFFTGSDWCGWCRRLKSEVFDTPEWKAWAKSVVLVELDFPRQKQLPAELVQQNVGLRDKYQIKGYPTLIFVDHTGKELGRTGYMSGGPKPWLANAQKITAKLNAVDAG